jgi:NAD-dependent deacetylase
MDDQILQVADLLRRASNIVILTGAGISAESGLRTFRGASKADLPATMQALWKEFDPMKLATPEAFNADPAAVSRWYDWRRLGCLAAEPNPGHNALADIERRVSGFAESRSRFVTGSDPQGLQTPAPGPRRSRRFTLLTQNVDRLHQKAGSKNVVELHGSIIQWRCTSCDAKLIPAPDPLPTFPMRATCCPGDKAAILRPDVVWFGEALPFEALTAADESLATCDLFLSIGTSSVVHPAASFIQIAVQNGARTVEINPEATPISRLVDYSVRGKSGKVLPEIVAAL